MDILDVAGAVALVVAGVEVEAAAVAVALLGAEVVLEVVAVAVAMSVDRAAAELEEAVRAIRGEARRRFSEQLNVELAELKNSRGLAGENLKREQQVEYLLGLFARVGEI
jgi:hypothetical protein